ncbi:MAG: class I SAM-dependent methyltransferase [Planctomycetota bacterium]
MRAPSFLVPFLLAACAGAPPEASVRPHINDDYTNPTLDVDAMVKRFEAESREVFARRAAIARAVDLRPGMAVADVGAGTGVFVDFFAKDVTASGRVYAVEIAPKFVAHLAERARARGLSQVEAVLGTERDVCLPEASTDVVFCSDTYHHFEYPRSTLASIHRALRPGGRFVVVDFERVPGVSREWVLGHVRCGKETVIAEVTAAGFECVGESDVGLHENYCLTFRRI